MKLCDVPADFDLDLGYRTVHIYAGKRTYGDEVAGAMPQYVVEEEEPAEEHHKRRSSASEKES